MVLALVVFLDFARLPISAPDGNSNSGNRLRARLIRTCRMETAVKSWTLYLASGIEAASAVVIGLAALEAILRSYALFFQRGLQLAPDKKEEIRLRLGRWLAVALEFEVAADILRTAIAPSWTEIGKLAAIVGLRTALNYFLQREIDREAKANPAAQLKQVSG